MRIGKGLSINRLSGYSSAQIVFNSMTTSCPANFFIPWTTFIKTSIKQNTINLTSSFL